MSDTNTETLRTTERTTLDRHPERGTFDRAAAYAILDEAFVTHIGFATERGPVVIPTVYARDGDVVYFHGSHVSRMMKSLGAGTPMCFTVTLVDGLVLARSAFYHSANYRSVMLFGVARAITDSAEKARAARVIVEHVVAGRAAEVRAPSDKELRATAFLALAIDEGSVKVRTGPPGDAPDDLLPESPYINTWAGVVPMAVTTGAPIAEEHVPTGVAPPALERFIRARRRA